MTYSTKSYIGAAEPTPHDHNISFQRQGRKTITERLLSITPWGSPQYHSFRLGPPQVSLCAENINPLRCNDKFGFKTLYMGSRSACNENASSVNICLENVELTLTFRHKNLASFDRFCSKLLRSPVYAREEKEALNLWKLQAKFTYLDQKARSSRSLHTVLWHPSKQWHCLPQKFLSYLVWALKTQDPDGELLAQLPQDDRHSPRGVNSV